MLIVDPHNVIGVTNSVTNLMLLTQVDDVPELLQEFSLSRQCPVSIVVVGGVTELTVSSQQGMEDRERHQAVRVAVQLGTEPSNVIRIIHNCQHYQERTQSTLFSDLPRSLPKE